MSGAPTCLDAGQTVRARRQYLEEVVPSPGPADSSLARMACVDDDAEGEPRGVLWENTVDGEILQGAACDPATKGFDEPLRCLLSTRYAALRYAWCTPPSIAISSTRPRAGRAAEDEKEAAR